MLMDRLVSMPDLFRARVVSPKRPVPIETGDGKPDAWATKLALELNPDMLTRRSTTIFICLK